MIDARNILVVSTCLLIASAGIGGCIELSRSPSAASTGNARSLAGTWLSSVEGSPSPESCGNFEWRVTSTQGATVSGEFSATCAGGIELRGTATGTQEVSLFRWQASGAATSPDVPACQFALSGTAVPEVDTIRVEYSGSTCLGPVSGTEVLRRQ